MNGRKWRGYERTGFLIVETNDRDIPWDFITSFFDCFHGT